VNNEQLEQQTVHLFAHLFIHSFDHVFRPFIHSWCRRQSGHGRAETARGKAQHKKQAGSMLEMADDADGAAGMLLEVEEDMWGQVQKTGAI
jgi:hypothetical protein